MSLHCPSKNSRVLSKFCLALPSSHECLAGGTKPAGSTGFLGAAERQCMRIIYLAIHMYSHAKLFCKSLQVRLQVEIIKSCKNWWHILNIQNMAAFLHSLASSLQDYSARQSCKSTTSGQFLARTSRHARYGGGTCKIWYWFLQDIVVVLERYGVGSYKI